MQNYADTDIEIALHKYCDNDDQVQTIMNELRHLYQPQQVPRMKAGLANYQKIEFFKSYPIDYAKQTTNNVKRTQTLHYNATVLKQLDKYRANHQLYQLTDIANQTHLTGNQLHNWYYGITHIITKNVITLANDFHTPVSYWLNTKPSDNDLDYTVADTRFGLGILQEYQQFNELTVEQLARQLRIPYSYLKAYFAKQRPHFNLAYLQHTAKVTGLSVDDFCYKMSY